MRIQHNIMAMSAYRNYTNNVSAMKKNLEKLSSGYKINRAGDDAAGLAISEKMRAQITGLETAQKNAKDGISLVQTAEGALTEVHDMLNRMVELATQSANGTYDDTTDRAQMQKEVNQLLSEINRIADSSNFNGIKLLDGTLGLNTDAFSFSGVSAQEATDGTIDISSLVAKKSDGSPKVHLEGAAVAAAAPGGAIDLSDLKVKLAAATATTAPVTATLTFNIGGKDVAVTLTNKATNATTKSASDIATALVSALQKDADFGVDNSGAAVTAGATGAMIKIGDAAYSIAASGTAVKLTYGGYYDAAGKFTKEAAFTGDEAAAKSINNSLGFDVTVKTTGTGVTQSGDVIHKATQVQQAKAEKLASKAGIDIKLTEDLLVDGATLTIDGHTFTIKTDAKKTTVTSSAGNGVIDISGLEKDDMLHALADKLSAKTKFTGQDGREWQIGVNGDGTTIHIDQVKDSTANKLDTYDKLVGVIKAKGEAKTANNAGTKITIDDAQVKEGNTLSIDGKKYVFTDDKDNLAKNATAKEGDPVYVAIKGGAAKNLQAAIGGTSKFDAADNSVTVYAAKAEGNAPMILGKGLTLQIGDTSDSFNQLNVAVQDMHADTLGIKDLKIDTEEAAQAAVNKIKAAINTVSDVRGTLGATQNRLDHTINNLSVMTENIQDAESTIRDVDVAEEMMAYTKNNILIQSAQAMLAQANQVPQGVLQLLQ